MATTLSKNGILVNVVPTTIFRENEFSSNRPSVARLNELTRQYDILSPMCLSPFDPIGEFTLAILDTPKMGRHGDNLNQEYSDHLDSIDSAEFELPEDYRV